MNENYITALRYAQTKNLPFKTVIALCKEGKFEGAILKEGIWYINKKSLSIELDQDFIDSATQKEKPTDINKEAKSITTKKSNLNVKKTQSYRAAFRPHIFSIVISALLVILYPIWAAPAFMYDDTPKNVYELLLPTKSSGGYGFSVTTPGNTILVFAIVFVSLSLVISLVSIFGIPKGVRKFLTYLEITLLAVTLTIFVTTFGSGLSESVTIGFSAIFTIILLLIIIPTLFYKVSQND